jgi:shikimate kinase
LVNKNNIKRTCTVVYLQESYEPLCSTENENKVNELVFEDRDAFLKQITDILVENLDNSSDCLSLIFKAMKSYFNLG